MRKSIEIPAAGQAPLTGRDKGKTFLITEMDAWDAEAWGQRAYGCMVRAGLKPTQPGGPLTGMAAVAVYGVSAFLAAPWAEVEPLLAEMMVKCVRIKEAALPLGREFTRDDVEEVQTILRLREEAVKLHTDFSLAANLLAAVIQAMAWMDGSSATPTSTPSSAPSSRPVRRRSTNSKRSIRQKTSGSSSKS